MTAQAVSPAGAHASGAVADLRARVRDSLAEVSHRYAEAAARRRTARAHRAERTRALEAAWTAMQTYRDAAALGTFARFA